jgi:hypothetical protein
VTPRTASIPALVAGAIALALELVLLAVLVRYGQPIRVVLNSSLPVAYRALFLFQPAYVVSLGLAAAIGALVRPGRVRAFLLGAACAGFYLLGVLLIFSFGLLLLLCAVLTTVSLVATSRRSHARFVIGGITATLIAFAAGPVLAYALTPSESRSGPGTCPPQGQSEVRAGSNGRYEHWWCDGGRVVYSPPPGFPSTSPYP